MHSQRPQVPDQRNDPMMTKSLEYLLEGIRDSVCSVSDDQKDTLLEDILKARTVFIYGAGRSGLVGQLFAVRLVQLGLDVHFIGDMTTPIISRDDLTILISNTGETMSAVQTANIARRIGSKVTCITGNPSSRLAHASNDVITLKHDPVSDQEYAPLGTMFEDSVSIFFDCIIPCLMKKMGISEDEMRKKHAIWV